MAANWTGYHAFEECTASSCVLNQNGRAQAHCHCGEYSNHFRHDPAPPPSGHELATLLSRHRFRFHTEAELQDGVADVFSRNRLAFEREAVLTPHDRPDFMVGELAVEVKIAGAVHELLRQCSRYLQHPGVKELLIVAGSYRLSSALPSSLCGKPVTVVNVRSQL